MDLSRPERGLLSPGFASVLRTLVATRAPLTGRVVAELSNLSQNGALKVLSSLEETGVVLREPAGRAALFRLNRSHLLTAPLVQILGAGTELRQRLSEQIVDWVVPPVHVSLFGSVARDRSGLTSDIDLLAIRPDAVSFDDHAWREQLSGLARNALEWTGNTVSWLELSERELSHAVATNEEIVAEWGRDGIHLAGVPYQDLLAPTLVAE